MERISSFVFFDIETTGLPHQERCRTKIVELCFVAVARRDLRRATKGIVPAVSKLSFLLNPHRVINSAAITGLTNDWVKYAPTFKEKINTINSFLEDLSKPVCLVAHNGNTFDYKILLAECMDANVNLPQDLLCVDTLPGFRKLLKMVTIEESILTDDEDKWPDLNITPEEYRDIDELCLSLSDMSCENLEKYTTKKKAKKVACIQKKRESYKLTDIYKRLLNKETQNAHRAEEDCLMLLQSVGVCQNLNDASKDFLRWMDDNCKKLNEITPLQRK